MNAWPGRSLLIGGCLVALVGLPGCSETITRESKIRVDVHACLSPAAATGGGGAACGTALTEQAATGLAACLAYRVGAADQAALALQLQDGQLVPVQPQAFPVEGAQRVTLRLFLLKPGQGVEACPGYTVETPCTVGDPATPASCLMAFRAESTAVSGDGRAEITYGSAEVACGIQCNDLCRPNDDSCRKLCWTADALPTEYCNGVDDDCDGEIDEGYQVGEACPAVGQCAAGVRECACHAGAGCDPTNLADPRWQQARCATGPQGSGDQARPEQCNGLDDDCDGQTDEDWPSLGKPCTARGVCGDGVFRCQPAGDNVCCSTDPTCSGVAPAPEQCNGLDDDCDGALDEELVPPAGLGCPQLGVCAGFLPACQASQGWVCQYPALRYEVIERTCDGADNDCDGQIDEELAAPLADRQVGVCQGTFKVCGGNTGWQEPEYERLAGYEAEEVTCDGEDNDCDGATDEGCDCLPGEEQPCGSDVGECQPGTQTCNGGGTWDDCLGGRLASPELCNELDDDCDGEPDDGNPEGGARCGSNVGECRQGLWLCTAEGLVCDGATGPAPEVCDNRDQDCNGEIDDGEVEGNGEACGSTVGECHAGTRRCELGLWVCDDEGRPRDETCNGKDDDCDDQTDEGNPGGGALCGSTVGECRQGQLRCQGGQLRCVGATEPAAELCDGRDNDCNGLIDDAVPGFGEPCGESRGACEPGRTACVLGQTVCQGETGPGLEVCNGVDDDCDDQTDEGLTPPLADRRLGLCAGSLKVCGGLPGWQEPDYTLIAEYTLDQDNCEDLVDNDCDGTVNEGCRCERNDVQPCGETTGECAAGTQTCNAQGEWGPCEQATGPQDELCNGLDDDCDGQTDEDFGLATPCTGPGSTGSPCAVAGVWECDAAQVDRICSTGPGGSDHRDVPERCNHRDDDCDGQVDEDFRLGQECPGTGGMGSPCGPGRWECDLATGEPRCSTHPGSSDDRSQAEVCNDEDDDCDFRLDDVAGAGDDCTAPGVCGAGVQECDVATGALRCSTAPGGSQHQDVPEQCNGLDDDCDGVADEDFGLGTGCTGIGTCGPGRWECDPATLGRRCSSNPGSSDPQAVPETCDNLDNDCDSATDEELPTQTCGQGACAQVPQPTCTDGVPQNCNPFAGKVDEIANNQLDDDCDGQVDEVTCPVGWSLFADTGHCYRYVNTYKKGDQARDECRALGAGVELVSILSVAEQNFVDGLRGNYSVWIGLRRANTWSWYDGSPVSYTNWEAGQPTAGDGCVRMTRDAGNGWARRRCNHVDDTYHYVCERVP